MNLTPYLEDLERRIDDADETRLYDAWIDFTEGSNAENLFVPQRTRAYTAGIEWPKVSVNATLDDVDTMIYHQLAACSWMLEDAAVGRLLCVRPNYGTGTLSSMFGPEVKIMDEVMDILPTTVPLEGGADAVQRVVDAGLPDVETGLVGKTYEFARRFRETVAPYPNIEKHVHLYHPDYQGPMDVAELIWGSSIFYALFDTPDLVHKLLRLVTDTYKASMQKWEEVQPWTNGHSVHWSMLHKGHIMLRDDSAMNLSPEMFDEFIRPYDQELLNAFEGGAVHFCGRGDHYIASLCGMDNMHAVAMSQPEYNDMETIYRATVDAGIPLIGFRREAADAAVENGRQLHGRVHVWGVGVTANCR